MSDESGGFDAERGEMQGSPPFGRPEGAGLVARVHHGCAPQLQNPPRTEGGPKATETAPEVQKDFRCFSTPFVIWSPLVHGTGILDRQNL